MTIPALNEMSPRGQEIVLYYMEVARMEGWLAGFDHAEAHHWGAPDYVHAVRSLKAIGIAGLDRREYARRREVA